jgi:hypothetical protein
VSSIGAMQISIVFSIFPQTFTQDVSKCLRESLPIVSEFAVHRFFSTSAADGSWLIAQYIGRFRAIGSKCPLKWAFLADPVRMKRRRYQQAQRFAARFFDGFGSVGPDDRAFGIPLMRPASSRNGSALV